MLQVFQILQLIPFYSFLLYCLGHVFIVKFSQMASCTCSLMIHGTFVITVQNYGTTDFSMERLQYLVMYDLLPKLCSLCSHQAKGWISKEIWFYSWQVPETFLQRVQISFKNIPGGHFPSSKVLRAQIGPLTYI